jgi:lipoprotein-anchoring transpeptidase ErfK/SrfK
MTNRSRVTTTSAAIMAAAVGALVLSGCNATANAHWQGSTPATGATLPGTGAQATSGPSAGSGSTALAMVPAANAKNVSPGKPVVITASGAASVTSVTLAAGSTKIAGRVSADGHTWTSDGPLKYNTTYTVTVSTAGLPSNTTTSTFTTVKPARTVNPTLQANAMLALRDGATYGVGQPLIVHFNTAVPTSARAGVVKALDVSTSLAVPGRWHWIDSQDVHYRGSEYWPTGTTININANLYGVSFGNGAYGSKSVSATIHIGASHIAIADNKTHHMKVYVNGSMVKDIPVSLGSGGTAKGSHGETIDFWTRSGPHVVIIKTPSHVMSSASYGLTDVHSPYYYAPETIYDTVRISYAGEFVHKRTWSLSKIGHANTSHGCINVGPDNSKWIYNLLIPGDIVDVTGTPKQLPVWDGLGDWTIPYAQW